MLYGTLVKKLKSLPQAGLEEVSSYVDYIFFKFTESKKILQQKVKKKVLVV